jgi:hypothetical protein
VENEGWDEIAQKDTLFSNLDESSISEVSWRVSSRKDMTKEFCDGKKIDFNFKTMVQLYVEVLLGGGE